MVKKKNKKSRRHNAVDFWEGPGLWPRGGRHGDDKIAPFSAGVRTSEKSRGKGLVLGGESRLETAGAVSPVRKGGRTN